MVSSLIFLETLRLFHCTGNEQLFPPNDRWLFRNALNPCGASSASSSRSLRTRWPVLSTKSIKVVVIRIVTESVSSPALAFELVIDKLGKGSPIKTSLTSLLGAEQPGLPQ